MRLKLSFSVSVHDQATQSLIVRSGIREYETEKCVSHAVLIDLFCIPIIMLHRCTTTTLLVIHTSVNETAILTLAALHFRSCDGADNARCAAHPMKLLTLLDM